MWLRLALIGGQLADRAVAASDAGLAAPVSLLGNCNGFDCVIAGAGAEEAMADCGVGCDAMIVDGSSSTS